MRSPTRLLCGVLLLLSGFVFVACSSDKEETPAADTGAADPGAVADPGPGENDPGTEPVKDEGSDPGETEEDPGPADEGPADPGIQGDTGADAEDASVEDTGPEQDTGEADAADEGPSDASTGAPVCVYETMSADADCPQVCQATAACTAPAVCEASCIAARHVLRQVAMDAVTECTIQTGCDGVPEGFDDPGEYCVVEVTKTAVGPDGLDAACEAVAAKAKSCGLDEGELSGAIQTCPMLGRLWRPEVVTTLEACAQEECDALAKCVKDSKCGLF